MYFSPEREFLENSVIYSQKDVNGTVNLMAYKGNAYVTSRFSESSNLYSETEASMDSLEGFSPEVRFFCDLLLRPAFANQSIHRPLLVSSLSRPSVWRSTARPRSRPASPSLASNKRALIKSPSRRFLQLVSRTICHVN